MTYNNKGLKELLKILTTKQPMAQVGVLGDKDKRVDEGSNASIGRKHEFGDDGMPIRSFLRIPISENMQKYLQSAGLDGDVLIKTCLEMGSMEPLIAQLGVLGKRIVLDGFDTGGFGKWPASNMKRKKNHQTLVETQQLRNSIQWDVVD
jgi:hypothetical protein